MKKAAVVFACAALFLALVMPQSASAQPAGGYEVTGYDVKAVISEDNVYNVTETINVRFNEKRHGIYRDIPINGEMTRPSSVSDVKVERWDFTVQDDRKTVSIRIGSAEKYVTGDKTYRISYKLKFGDGGADRFDEVNYNIIGTDGDAAIDNVTFSITLPKEFDEGNIGFSAGAYGTSGYDQSELTYTVDGNTVSGSMRRLDPYEGITMRIELPEGYFSTTGSFKIPDWMGRAALWAILYTLLGL